MSCDLKANDTVIQYYADICYKSASPHLRSPASPFSKLNKSHSGRAHGYTSYVAASYVKWLESAGALVAPIRLWRSTSYYERMLRGGGAAEGLQPKPGAEVYCKTIMAWAKA